MKTFKWTETQKKALRGSIRKWTKISNLTGVDNGPENCACCRIWNKDKRECSGCPIKAFTGKAFCNGTPYQIWERENHYMVNDVNDYLPEAVSIALSFANFLRAVYLAGGGK